GDPAGADELTRRAAVSRPVRIQAARVRGLPAGNSCTVLSASGGGIMADSPPPVAQPDVLSPLDYLLHRGESHPSTRSAFLNLEILDQPADWGRLREAMERASRVVIRMRQKVVIPPLPTTPPRWVVDPDFDLDYHLRRVALPAP